MSSRGPLTKTAVEKPPTEQDLARLLAEAAAAGKAVVPIGGGRAGGMGGTLERCVIEHSPADMVVSVEAGITLEALQAELAKAGQFLPIDPFNSPGHTVGGLLATGWSGPLRLRYGSPRDFLIGIRVALPDGLLASAGGRVVKNVSGYDLMKLHYGAMGSLGIIVAASFKVFPKPLSDVTLESRHASIDEAWVEAGRALDLPLAPAALELFSDSRVLAELCGSPDAVERMVRELAWTAAAPALWEEHGRAAPERWARITVSPSKLRGVLDSLPVGSTWWASPGVGVAHWSFDDADAVTAARAAAEAAGGSLVLLAASDDVKKRVGAWGSPSPTLEVMRRLKDAFDPRHVLNPGRFVV